MLSHPVSESLLCEEKWRVAINWTGSDIDIEPPSSYDPF
jgi:hypothetical protein